MVARETEERPGKAAGRYFIETWGCQMNIYDSGRFARQLEQLGYVAAEDEASADLILLNTCSVREKAAQKMFSRLGRLRVRKRDRPNLVVGVAGCVAQQEREHILTRAPAVDFVVGTKAVGQLPSLLERVGRGRRPIDVEIRDDRYDEIRPIAPGRARRAYLTVVEGCNKACSFCIVPTTRGPEVNRAPDAILAEARANIDEGVLELELLGQNVNAYRFAATDFAALLRMVDRVPGLRRLRFTTSHPRELTDDVIEAMADAPTVSPHLHLPVQSGSDEVLKRMYRGYDRARYLSRIRKLRAEFAGIALSTDIIVGFPGETSAQFDDTMRLVNEVEFDQIFAFVYSPRPHTRAAELEDPIPKAEKDERLQRLLRRQDEISKRQNQALIGTTAEVLVEGPSRKGGGERTGRTEHNRIVNFQAPTTTDGIIPVRITGARAHSLIGELT